MSSLGWIDYSATHREKVKQVLTLLAGRGVVDELGIGIIRDAFSDVLFPGLSTVQTRAKYFVATARILNDYARLPEPTRKRKPPLAYLYEHEDDCIKVLVEGNDGGETGIFGTTYHGTNKKLRRRPSEVYWGGLRTFGIIHPDLSLADFVRTLVPSESTELLRANEGDDVRGDDNDAVYSGQSKIQIPDFQKGWQSNLTITLTRSEADFLRNRLTSEHVKGSLLAALLSVKQLRQDIVGLPKEAPFEDMVEAVKGRIPPEVERVSLQAVDFARLIAGVHIRYNHLLQTVCNGKQESGWEGKWQNWADTITSDGALWRRWNTDALWEVARRTTLPQFTRTFVTFWIDFARSGCKNLTDADRRIIAQEQNNKTGRARLAKKKKVSEKWLGIDGIGYRWGTARRMITDIHRGLNLKEA